MAKHHPSHSAIERVTPTRVPVPVAAVLPTPTMPRHRPSPLTHRDMQPLCRQPGKHRLNGSVANKHPTFRPTAAERPLDAADGVSVHTLPHMAFSAKAVPVGLSRAKAVP